LKVEAIRGPLCKACRRMGCKSCIGEVRRRMLQGVVPEVVEKQLYLKNGVNGGKEHNTHQPQPALSGDAALWTGGERHI
jgi:hypothetical protein